MAIYVYKQIACMYGKVRRFHWDRKSNTIKCVEAIVWIRRLLLYKKRKIAKFQIMKHLVQLCFCSDFDDFLFAQRHLVVSLRIAWEVNRLWLPPGSSQGSCLHRGRGSWGPESGVRGWEFLLAMAGSSFRSLWEIGWTGAILWIPTWK